MDLLLNSSAVQANLVLALAGVTSAWVTVARPTLSHKKGESHTCPPATLFEAGTSPVLSSTALAAFRAVMAIYIVAMGAAQISRLGTFVFKFYTIWNWWLLGLYFTLAALASVACVRREAAATGGAGGAAGPVTTGKAAGGAAAEKRAAADVGAPAGVAGQAQAALSAAPAALQRPTPLSRACHALFMINCATVIIVDVVCWTVLYPMLARGPQTPEIERIIRRLLMTFTSYNQHGFNAVFIFTDLFLNRQRLAFHAVGPLGLWSLLYGVWAHIWHAKTGKWLYPFLDTSKPWAPGAYFGLYVVHWLAFALVALLYRVKASVYGSKGRGAAGVAAAAAAAAAGAKAQKAE